MERVEGGCYLSTEVKFKVQISLLISFTIQIRYKIVLDKKRLESKTEDLSVLKRSFSCTVKTSHVGFVMAHSMYFCRPTTFWQSGGFGGRGSGVPGRSVLWPPVSGNQPTEQRGGEGVVR